MTKQLLFYERAVPVSSQRHRDWSLEARTDYQFAAHTNSVPLAAVEFPPAAVEYTIVFAGSEQVVQPVVILGLKPDENRYLDAQGKWQARYIPAFVRRYPFVFSKSQDGTNLTLCIDEHYSGWNQENRGERLFDTNGEGTKYLNGIFEFVKDYQRQFDRTRTFCQKLTELGLLESMKAQFKLPTGEKAQLTGFMAVSRDKLKELPGDVLAELARTGELEMIYVHLQSLRNLGETLARFTRAEPTSEAWQQDILQNLTQPLH